MRLIKFVGAFFCLCFLMFFSSCSKSESEIKKAEKILSHVNEMFCKDSLPQNDSILHFPIKVFKKNEMDSCLALSYFLQGEIFHRSLYLLRATDSYSLAAEHAGCDSLLYFRIYLQLTKINRFKMLSDQEEMYIAKAENLLPYVSDSSDYNEFMHQKAIYFLQRDNIPEAKKLLKTAISELKDGSSDKVYFYRQLSQVYLKAGEIDSTLYCVDLGLRAVSGLKQKSELLLLKGLAYAVADREDSAKVYIDSNLFHVDIPARMKACRMYSDMYKRLNDLPMAYKYLEMHALLLDTLVTDRREELVEKIRGIDEYKLQKNRANKAELEASLNQLMFSYFILASLLLIMFLLSLLYYYHNKRRKLAEKLRQESCLKMEESLKRQDMEIVLARKQEELKSKEIEKLNKSIDYYKQLNSVTIPVIMKRQNAQGALHLTDDDWNIIVGNADACFDMFSDRLKKFCPALTDEEIRFCCLVKMELSMSLLSEIYHIAKASISRRKMRLKEKMGVENVSFDEFISDF